MNWVDYSIIAVILLSAVVSLVRGFFRELLALVVWIAAVTVGYLFYPHLAQHMGFVESEALRGLAAFTVLFLASMVIGMLVSYLFNSLFDKVGISGTDRLLGGIFGAFRGAVLIVVAVLIAGMAPFSSQPWWQQSMLLGHFVDAALWLRQQLPPDIAAYFPHL